jgi:hypothetical protein
MRTSKKRYKEDTTPTSPAGRSPRRKKIQRNNIPPKPVFSDASSDDGNCTSTSSYRVMYEDHSSAQDAPTHEERREAARARMQIALKTMDPAYRPRSAPVMPNAERAASCDDPGSSSSEEEHVEDRRAAANARWAAAADIYRQRMDAVDAVRRHTAVGRVYKVPVHSSATVLDDSSGADTDVEPHTVRSFASTLVHATSRPKCLAPVNIARRKKYAEQKLLANARSTSNDKLMYECLQTKVGAKAMPVLASEMGTTKHHGVLAANAKRLMSLAGGRHRQEMAHLLTSGLPTAWCRDELGLTKASAKRATEALRKRTPSQVALDASRSCANARYAEGTDRTSRNMVGHGEDMAYDTFFHRTTHQCSGADVGRSRIMDREYFTWEADLSAQWPGILRELAVAHPQLVPALGAIPKTGWTKFEASMLAAVHGCPDDPTKEREDRHARSVAAHCRHLAVKAGRLPVQTIAEKNEDHKERRAVLQSRLTASEFDPTTYEVTAPTLDAFRNWLAWKGYRYTRYTVPHPCPLCDAGPVDELVFAELRLRETALRTANEPVPGELAQRITNLRTKNRLYRVHLDQLRECRAAVQKAEKELKPGTAMIIRDFVNHHDHGGKHVKCLHWVLTWRDEEDGTLRRLKLRHYCSDVGTQSCDSYFQADVTDFHLAVDKSSCPGLMERFHTLIFVGDHGPHFSCHETMHNESTILRRYGKIIKLMFLTSYHAYSRADGSGAEDSTGLRRDFIAGMPRHGATAMKNMTNDSNDQCSWAYEFPVINRSMGLFPAARDFQATDKAKWIRKWTEVTFHHPDNLEVYDGIMQYRLVTGVGPWRWTDLVAASRGPTDTMCDSCSTKAEKIVYHLQIDCPQPDYIHDLPVFEDLLPDAARITGLQHQRERKSGAKKATTFPCKIPTCPNNLNKRRAHRSAKTANAHMRADHALTDTQYAELAYPDDALPTVAAEAQPPKKRGRPKKVPAQSEGEASKTHEVVVPLEVGLEDPEQQPDSDSGPPNIVGQENEMVVNPMTPEKPDRPVRPKPKGVAPKKNKRPAKKKDSESESDSDSESPEEDETPGESSGSDDDDEDADDDDESPQYEVDAIKKHKLQQDGTHKYLVKWTGYPNASWEQEWRLRQDLRDDYHQDVMEKERQAASAHAVAAALQPVHVRPRRVRGKTSTEARSAHLDQLAARTRQLEATGLSYWKAHGKAQAELGCV